MGQPGQQLFAATGYVWRVGDRWWIFSFWGS